MNFSEVFIRRPIATSLLMAGIVLFGIIGYNAMPVSDVPTVDYPTINVSASLPGADPATMSSAVASVLERQFTGIAGLDSMTSRSSTGSTNVSLQFSLDRDIEGAATDVQSAIAAVTPLLPAGLPAPPSFHKQNPSDQPIIFLSLYSDTMSMSDIDEFAEKQVAPRIAMINGVSQVNVMGQQKYAVRVQLDPDALAARKIGLNDIDTQLNQWNVNSPLGTLYGPHMEYNIYANGQLYNAAQFRKLIIGYDNGAPIRLEDVANVIDSVQDDKQAAWVYSRDPQTGKLRANRAITLMVMRQPGTNTVEVTDNVRALIPLFREQLPPALTLIVRGDRSVTIRRAFDDIEITMGITLLLVVGVIFFFLRNASATIIPSLALPFTILGALAIMATLDFSLDNMSMMALILAIGFIVDDAIVMLENIVRHIENGEEPFEAALKGSKEIGFTIVSMTTSLAAVFIPILFMSGILGRLFREFAITITVAILISGLVSITLTPMLCSRFLKPHDRNKRHNLIYRATEWFFATQFKVYEWSLKRVLKYRPVMAVMFFVVVGATLYLFVRVPKGFIPDQDIDQINLQMVAAQGTSFYEMLKYQTSVADVVASDPNVDTFMSSVGGGFGGQSGNNANMNIILKPANQRKLTMAQVMDELRPKIAGYAGFQTFMRVPPTINIGTRGSRAAYELTVLSPDTDALARESNRLLAAVQKESNYVVDVNSDLQVKSPRVNVVVDRDRAASLGLDVTQIENALYAGYGPKWSSTIYSPTNQYEVLMEIQQKYQAYSDYLSKIYFHATNGALIPISEVVKVKDDAMPQTINHTSVLPSVTISFNLKDGVALGDAVDRLNEVAARTLPDTMQVMFTGTAQVFQASLKNLTVLLIVAIGVVYIVLGVLYESYIHPFTILSGLPSACLGALATLIFFHVDLNIYSFVGLVLLVGLVKKNAIMQIDFALEAERKGNKTPAEAIYEGCLIRFRPIMMTTWAALLGAVPMALGYGSGGEARRPLGLAVCGGLLISQAVTLYLTPVVYTYMASLLDWWRRRHPETIEAEPVYGD
ncbi:MAG TPA: efflux RND transporter permease subunit [Bryobacteraceae bacterium]|nr:efflux RND transporter permease subunit [Bryobacteraceae bacterium]